MKNPSTKPPKLKDLAARIQAHFTRFEKDPKINIRKNGGLLPFFCPRSWAGGKFVYVKYITFQCDHPLTRAEAVEYLARLDAGEQIKHFDLEKFK